MQMMAVDVKLDPVFAQGSRERFSRGVTAGAGRANYDVTPDGQRFLMLQPVQSTPITELQLVVNWFEELRARMRPSSH